VSLQGAPTAEASHLGDARALPGWRTRTRFLVGLLVVLIVLVALAFYWWQHSKVYLRDDYRNGYAIGAEWRVEDIKGDCQVPANRLYPGTSGRGLTGTRSAPLSFDEHRYAFMVGCSDGLSGVPEAGWNLHSRLVSPGQ